MSKEIIYEIGYWSNEEAPRTLLTNDKDYTQDQFNALIVSIVKILRPALIEIYESLDKVWFEDILDDIISHLERQYGFKQIKPTVIFRPYGLASIRDAEHCVYATKNDVALGILREALK